MSTCYLHSVLPIHTALIFFPSGLPSAILQFHDPPEFHRLLGSALTGCRDCRPAVTAAPVLRQWPAVTAADGVTQHRTVSALKIVLAHFGGARGFQESSLKPCSLGVQGSEHLTLIRMLIVWPHHRDYQRGRLPGASCGNLHQSSSLPCHRVEVNLQLMRCSRQVTGINRMRVTNHRLHPPARHVWASPCRPVV